MNEKRQKGLPMYPGATKTYSFLTLFIILESIAIIAQAFFLARAITDLFNSLPISDIFTSIGLFFIAYMARYILSHIQAAIAEKFALETTTMLREKVFHTYFNQSATKTQKLGTGHLITLAMEGVDHVKTYVEIIGIRMIKTFVLPISIEVGS